MWSCYRFHERFGGLLKLSKCQETTKLWAFELLGSLLLFKPLDSKSVTLPTNGQTAPNGLLDIWLCTWVVVWWTNYNWANIKHLKSLLMWFRYCLHEQVKPNSWNWELYDSCQELCLQTSPWREKREDNSFQRFSSGSSELKEEYGPSHHQKVDKVFVSSLMWRFSIKTEKIFDQ